MNTKRINGFSLALSLITIGFFSLYFKPFNTILGLDTSYYVGLVIISIGVIGLLGEISKLVKKESGTSDISVSIFLIIIIYFTWKAFDYLGWLNNLTISILMFLGLVVVYSVYRGIALIISYIMMNYEKKRIS